MTPTIGAFIESSLIEWPGKIAAAIALQGCNLRCPFCHSAPLVPAKGTEVVPLDGVLEHFHRLRGWIDGTVVSGGEPLMHSGVLGFLGVIKDAGLRVKLDTNGTFPDRLAEACGAGLVDYLAIDLKAPLDEAKYALAAGVKVDVGAVRRSMEIAAASGLGYEYRTTLCPKVLSEEDVLALAADVGSAPRWYLQQFRPMGCLDPAMLEVEPWHEETVLALAERCREVAPGCLVRGRNLIEKRASAEAGK